VKQFHQVEGRTSASRDGRGVCPDPCTRPNDSFDDILSARQNRCVMPRRLKGQ
jgi:hypothetical protein